MLKEGWMSSAVNLNAQQGAMQQVLMRCWTDPEFKQALIDNPSMVLASQGITIPTGVNVVVVEDEPDRVHLVIPSKPGTDADLDQAAAAALSYINPAC
jgi:hypothetical protein